MLIDLVYTSQHQVFPSFTSTTNLLGPFHDQYEYLIKSTNSEPPAPKKERPIP